MTTRRNPVSAARSLCSGLRRALRRVSFHVRAWLLGFEIRHGLPV